MKAKFDMIQMRIIEVTAKTIEELNEKLKDYPILLWDIIKIEKHVGVLGNRTLSIYYAWLVQRKD